MDEINIIHQNKILVDVLDHGTVVLDSVFFGDAFSYSVPVVVVRCYTTEISFATTEEDEITLEDEYFNLEISFEDGEFQIGLKSTNLGDLGYIERVI